MKDNRLIRINEYYNIPKEKFDEFGVLNSFINYDVPMFVNPKLLDKSDVSELEDANQKIVVYFERLIKMLLKTNGKDVLWNMLKRYFSFKEPVGVGLGNSVNSTNGRGLSGAIAENCLKTLKEIVDLGFEDPDIYKLLFLVQDNIGVDRISDMICRILYDNLLEYTNNMIEKLDIKDYYEKDGLKRLKRPNGSELILMPSQILSDIPDVVTHEDIITCADKNNEIKEYLSEYFKKAYVNVTDINNSTQTQLRECVLNSKTLIKELLKNSKSKEINNYDYSRDDYAIFGRMDNIIENVSSKQEIFENNLKEVKSLNELCEALLRVYKFSIESLGINEEFYSESRKNKIRREQVSHKLFILVLETAKHFTNFEYSYESKVGNGQIEFVITNNKEKIIMEFKLTTNDLVHGYDKQLPEYIKRYKPSFCYYVIIDVIGNNKLSNFYKNKKESLSNCSIFEIDATIKPSPSNL